MPESRPDDDLLDLAHPYALDALSDEDRIAVERRLEHADEAGAAAFRAEVHELRETLAALTIVDAVPAPPDLEAKLQAALDAGADSKRPENPAPARPVTPLRPRGSRRVRWLAAAAAAVVVLAGVGAGIAVYRSHSHGTGEITAEQVMQHADARASTVAVAGGGTITVSASHELDAAAVSFAAVPPAPSNHTYQLWLISPAGRISSGGVLGTLPTNSAPLLVRYGDAGKLAVSVEPAGGSPAPTTQPIVGVPLT
ncbi:anti-sigma factor [Nocardia sp. CA2R105]|uniref:anti-sigma factor n=1 Tax=Nocardia coffeae TaxID=2873381 RepID=UPI001CA64ED4|nr:anti-sigma factor [Nocardia coffeae]MBY8861898.1 anti-sigma factor [Nocardia coffeae]